MALNIYPDKNKTFMVAHSMNEIENVSFRQHIIEFHSQSIYPILKSLCVSKLGFVTKNIETIIQKQAKELAEESVKHFAIIKIQPCFSEILNMEMKKKDQIRILKGATLTREQLGALFIQAEDKGYSFSHYKYEGDPTSVKKEDLPRFIHLKDDDTIEYYGETSLTDGQMKQIIEQANVIIVRILDNGKHWHCFLQTYKGLKGQESGEQGRQPHLHYLSDAFGISREELVEMIHNGRYPNTPVHIPLLDMK